MICLKSKNILKRLCLMMIQPLTYCNLDDSLEDKINTGLTKVSG